MCKIQSGSSENIFWDLGGQKLLRSIWKKYYQECHGLVFVVDCADESRVQEVRGCLAEVLANEELRGVPFLLLFNKIV
jgi:ADP-ribosylation factor related protein 1